MTPTSRLAVCEPESDILRGAARVNPEARIETPLSGAAFLDEWICESLMACLKVKESHRRCSVLDASVTLGAEQAATRDQELAQPDQPLAVPAYPSRARGGVYGGVRWAYGLCTVLCTESVRFVYGIVRFSGGPRRHWKDFTVQPIDGEQGGTGFLSIPGKRRAIQWKGGGRRWLRRQAGDERMPGTGGARVSDHPRGRRLHLDCVRRTGQREVAPQAIPLVVAAVIHQYLQKPLLLARALDQGQQGPVVAQEAP